MECLGPIPLLATFAGITALWAAVASTIAAIATSLALSQLLHNSDVLDELILGMQARLTVLREATARLEALQRRGPGGGP